MVRRCVVSIAIAFLFAGSAVFAQGQNRIDKYVVGPTELLGLPLASCGSFDLFEDYKVLHTVIDRFDASGTTVLQKIVQSQILYDRIYNPTNGKEVFAIPGTAQHNRFVLPVWEGIVFESPFLSGMHYAMGPLFFFTVPGYGRIAAQSGMFAYNGDTGELVVHGPSQYFDGDFAALCDYLK
jgi:hypothetical protein